MADLKRGKPFVPEGWSLEHVLAYRNPDELRAHMAMEHRVDTWEDSQEADNQHALEHGLFEVAP